MYKIKYFKYKSKYLKLQKLINKNNLKHKHAGAELVLDGDQKKIVAYKEKYKDFYDDELLNDYKSIVKYAKILLGIDAGDPQNKIKINDKYTIEENYFRIVDGGMVDGTQYVDDEQNKIGIESSSGVFELLKEDGEQILQIYVISHELSHIIVSSFIQKYCMSLYNEKIKGLEFDRQMRGDEAQAEEMLCDFLGIALLMIAAETTEKSVGNNLTPSMIDFYNKFNAKTMTKVWGENGDDTHPHPDIRLLNCIDFFDFMKQHCLPLHSEGNMNLMIQKIISLILQFPDWWKCGACTTLNKNRDKQNKCIICDTDRPVLNPEDIAEGKVG